MYSYLIRVQNLNLNTLQRETLMPSQKEQIRALLKGIETGDPASVLVVNEEKYIQHNPQTREGSEGLAALFQRLAKTSPKANVVRAFEDGDFVFAHTEYDFSNRNIGFEIFRFEDGQAVEHWDNIQPRKGPNASGHSMVDGVSEAGDHALTESNRHTIQSFVDEILIVGDLDKLQDCFSQSDYTEHSPNLEDDLHCLLDLLSANAEGVAAVDYRTCHRLLAEGDFVLSVCEGFLQQVPTSFFDLYRVAAGKIVEHWDTTEAIPARSEWKNDNGKF